MNRYRLLVLIGAILGANISASAADCSPDFGDKALNWVDREAGPQSRELAKVDYAARAFNFRLVGYERLHERIGKVQKDLDEIAQKIAALDNSKRTDIAQAVEREQASERFLTSLYSLATAIESVRQQNTEMLTPLDHPGFVRLGLGAVGRETLMSSMQEIGEFSAATLAGRYGIYVQVTFDENGTPESGHTATNAGMATTVGSALMQTGNPYGVAAGMVVLMAGAVLDAECSRKWEQQRDRVKEAATLLPSKLISEDEQWELVEKLERTEIDQFKEHGSKAAAVIDVLASRWKTLFAANATRAAAADAVLTVAKIDQIRRDLSRGIDPADIRHQVAITEIAADVGRVNDAVARGRVQVINSCLSVAGLSAEEDQVDGARFARAQFKVLRSQAGFAMLYGLLDQSDAYAEMAEREVYSAGASVTGRPCLRSGDAPNASTAVSDAVVAGAPIRDTRPPPLVTRRDVRSPKLVGHVDRESGRSAKAMLSPLSVGANLSFCVTMRDGGFYRCGGGGGAPYGDNFNNTGNPREDVRSGANDGSFANDNRRMSAKIEQSSQNITLRIQTTRNRVSEARQALPTWHETNGKALDQIAVRSTNADAADVLHEAEFRSATAPLLARVAGDLDAFTGGIADPVAVAKLMRSVGGADMSLPY